jgi:TonB family protein
MQRWILLAFLAFSTAGVVLSDSFSVAQQDQPEAQRKVLSQVAPAYPELARRTNVHGVVKLMVVVAPDGKVTSTAVVGGNPVLAQAAVDAVRKWRYEAAPQQTHRVVELRFDTPR